ncbi:MAG TPA: glycoside hydrolase family 2 TIM barrel-domain containing protein [Armatimonadota bacterium]|jgi:beta-galactosidase
MSTFVSVPAAMLVLALLAATAGAIPIPTDGGAGVSLDGMWRFKLEQAGDTAADAPRKLGAIEPITTPETFEPFFRTDYVEDAAWHDLRVPGNWEIAGYSPATYDHPDNASGFYRKWFKVPSKWAGQRVYVNFDGVQNGAELFLNGQPVSVSEPSWDRANYHESGWTAWQADLTPQVKFGERNLLAVRVTKITRSADLDSGDYFFLGGIHRTVTLFSVPQTHIEDFVVRTTLQRGGSAEVRVGVTVTPAREAPLIAVRIGDDAEWHTAPAVPGGTVEIAQVLSKPRLWSAEHPNLYPLTVELREPSGRVIQQIRRRIGVREVSIRRGVLMVNGVPVKLTGICRHDVYPDAGTAVGIDVWRKDLELMKAANINAIRTSHYPYGSGFYDRCDEMGFYVLDELPYCWCNADDPAMRPAFEQRARETVRRDRNHPSIIIWAVGNENKPGRNLQVAADIAKALDPSRPRLVSEMKADRYGVEMDDLHYTSPAEIRKRADDTARRAKWPMIFAENPNVWDVRNGADYGCLDLWAAVLKRNWDIVWDAPGIPGEFLWEWQDRAVQDKSPVKLYRFDRETGIQYAKTKGLVDGWRHPRPDYYHVKMVYSPIQVDAKADMASKPGYAVLKVHNRYSFTNLSEIRAEWTLLARGRKVEEGTARLALPPRTRRSVALKLPAGFAGLGADTLRIAFEDPRGWNIVTCQFPLTPAIATPALGPPPAGLPFLTFNLITRDTHGDPYLWNTAERHAASVINVKRTPEGAGLGGTTSMEGDIVMADAPTRVVGRVSVRFSDVRFAYRVEWTGEKADVQEIGWVFEMPALYDRFSWNRHALWTYYPALHIGRPAGTARPDSMDAHNTNLTRPDAFDFNSTKYECEWASLSAPDGHGLRVEFSADDRHQVRGGKNAEGHTLLYVNWKVCPPRDISSNAVPDLYLELQPGAAIESSFRVGSQQAAAAD